MKLLDFRLHEFARHSWVSDRARNVWWPRMQEVINRGADIACLSVLSGVRPCALRVIPAWQLFELYGKLPALGLTVEILETNGKLKSSYFNSPGRQAGRPVYYNVVIGSGLHVAAFKSAWDGDDDEAIDRFSGYPACCRRFFQETCVEDSRVDTIWRMAANLLEGEEAANVREEATNVREVSGPPHTNVLWRSLGLRAVNHSPCRFDCEATVELAGEFLEAGRSGGYSTQVGWLLEILSWPVEWSALHGIAEIKTPVLKMVTNTDATAEKYVVRRKAASYPEEGAQGLGFPYERPGRLPVTDSEGFKRGLANPITLVNIHSKNRPDTSSARDGQPGLPVRGSVGTGASSSVSVIRNVIDWSRMAEPQDDQYDTQVTLEFATTKSSPLRREPYVRRSPQGSPTIFDGAVAVRYIRDECPNPSRHANGPLEHPNIALGVEYVRRWPTVFMQFCSLMDSFHPMIDLALPTEPSGAMLGSSSHSEESMFGTMYGTCYDPLGLAQAFVHEMAHQKLRALGVSFETTTRLIINVPDELFESPIRKDKPRPMSAVFHAEYSFIYVTALDLKMIEAETDPQNRTKLLSLLARNCVRMEEGLAVIRKHVRVDPNGRKFADGFFDWAERVIAQGNSILKARSGTDSGATSTREAAIVRQQS
jgi:hypothetical protein